MLFVCSNVRPHNGCKHGVRRRKFGKVPANAVLVKK
jgi:hypothetical protein